MTSESINLQGNPPVARSENAPVPDSKPPVATSDVLPLEPRRLPSHIPALDGIRGLAVVLVLFCHGTQRPFGELANEAMGGSLDRAVLSLARICFTGVDLFFVLSGFLITGILFDAKGKDRYFTNFYARRTVRIFPLYYAFLVVFLVIWPHTPEIWSQGFGARPAPDIWYWLYHSNYAQAWYKYMGTPTEHVLHVSWSLAIEEQFYLVWPLVVFLCTRKALLKIAVGMFIAAVAWRASMVGMGYYPLATGWTPGRLDGLATGAFISLLARGPGGIDRLVKPSYILGPLAAAGIAATIVIMNKLGQKQGLGQTPGYLIIGPAFFAILYGSLLTITAAAAKGTTTNWFFAHPVMRMFGKYSYAIYLFHLPVMIWIAEWVFHPNQWRMGNSVLPGLAVFHIITWTLSVAAAWLSWNLMEKHFLKLKDYFPSGAHSEPKKVAVPATAPAH